MSASPLPLPSTSAILVAAGSASRMGQAAAARKPLLALHGRTILEHACAAFEACAAVREIVVVAHAEDVDAVERLARTAPTLRKVRAVVAGGALRTDSVRAGLRASDASCELVAVHDAARPLLSLAILERALAAAAGHGAALVALAVTDTVKTSADGRHAAATLDRDTLWRAQTPQVFRGELLRDLLDRAAREGFRPTDEAALHERYVGPIAIAPGSAENLKLTTPDDLDLCAAILDLRERRTT